MPFRWHPCLFPKALPCEVHRLLREEDIRVQLRRRTANSMPMRRLLPQYLRLTTRPFPCQESKQGTNQWWGVLIR